MMTARPDAPEDPTVAPALIGEEGEELIGAAWRARVADRELAGKLGQPPSTGAAASTAYLQALTRGPALPAAVEERLVHAAQAGDAVARAQLVEAFLPQISSMARIYRQTPRIQRLELLQEGVVGLLRAIKRFDPDRGVPFWTYASWWVRQAMQQLVAELTRPMILSDRALRELARVRDAQREAIAAGTRSPGLAEIAERAGLPVERAQTLLALDRPVRSLDEQLVDEDGAVASLGELVDDPLAESEYERVLDAIEAEELLALLAGLSDREREILRARYGLDGEEQSLAEVAARLGVSAERVRQLEQRALAKLRAAARPDGGAADGQSRRGRGQRGERAPSA